MYTKSWMLRYSNDLFPTPFARSLAEEVRLYDPDVSDFMTNTRAKKKRAANERLVSFQFLALSADFDSCMKVYEDVELSSKQRKKLKEIHNITPTEIRSFAIMMMMRAIGNEDREQKDFAKIAAILVSLNLDEAAKDEASGESAASKLIIKLAKEK